MSDSENVCLLFDMLNNTNLQLELEENFEDGRLNSSFNEETVLDYIKQIIEENEYDFEKALQENGMTLSLMEHHLI